MEKVLMLAKMWLIGIKIQYTVLKGSYVVLKTPDVRHIRILNVSGEPKLDTERGVSKELKPKVTKPKFISRKLQ